MAFSEGGRGFDLMRDMKGRRIIPEHEIDLSVARSGGPGGQGVNTAESKAVLRWHVGKSDVFSEEEKALIRQNLSVTGEDEVVLHCSEHRTQLANKKACIERLLDVVNKAIVVPEKRVATRKKKGVKAREAASDYREKKKKVGRGKVDWHE